MTVKWKFKVGDRVRVRSDASQIQCGTYFAPSMNKYQGLETTIKSVGSTTYYLADGDDGWCWAEEWLEGLESETITQEKSTMSLIDKFKELSTAEPLKSFVKYGVKTADGKLTPDGTELLLNILANQSANEAELVKVTDAMAKADKDKK